MVEVKEIRDFVREEAKKVGLPGKGRCYNDKRKTQRKVQVGLAHGGRGTRRPSETYDEDWATIEKIAKKASKKFGVEVVAARISHGCPCCAGVSLGVRFVLPV